MKNRLKELRTERQWSQKELTEKLGVSRQTINGQLETGAANRQRTTRG